MILSNTTTYRRYLKTGLTALLLAVAFLSFSQNTNSQDHQKTKTPDVPLVVTDDIAAGIKDYIDEQVEAGNGYFHLKTEDKDLSLNLVRVHTEYLANLGPREHFACVDLADKSGDVYDVDFFLTGDPGNMTVTRTTVHKLNGKPFYSWSQREDDTWITVPVEESSSKLLGVIEGRDHFTFQYQITLPEITDDAQIWIPLAQSDPFQKIDVVSIQSPVAHQVVKDQEFGNTSLYMELSPGHSGDIIELTYDVDRKEKEPYQDNTSPNDYLSADLLMPVNDRFTTLADSIIGDKINDNTLMQARALYDYLIDNMRYIKNEKYGTGDAVYACDALLGNCTEFHSFFISLARSAGIPARFAIGAAIPSERNAGGVNGYHCWAEFYAQDKWWPIDISEANKYSALSTYYFGRHPANRIEFSRGRDLEFEPGPKSGPIPFFAYPVLEVDGKTTPVKTFFQFTRKGI